MTDVELFKNAMRILKKRLQDTLVEKNQELKNANQAMINEARKISRSVDGTKPEALVFQEMLSKVLDAKDVTRRMEIAQANVKNLENFIYNMGNVIESYQENLVTNKLDLPSLLELMAYAHEVENVPFEALLKCFGLAVVAGEKKLSKSEKIRSRDEQFVIAFINYFNPDGTLRFNEHIDFFENMLKKLCLADCYITELRYFLGVNVSQSIFPSAFKALLEQNNIRIINAMPENKTSALRFKLAIRSILTDEEKSKYSEEAFTMSPTEKEENEAFLRRISMAFDNEKCINPLNLAAFLGILQSTTPEEISCEDISVCLGMLVHQNHRAMMDKTNKYIELNPKEVRTLLEYYNEDGSFKENPRVEAFRKLIYDLLNKAYQEITLKDLEATNPNFSCLADDLAELLEKSNRSYKEQRDTAKTQEIHLKTPERLREFYRNNRLVKMPEDMKEFACILEESGLDEAEKRFIMGEIETKAAGVKEVKVTNYLFGEALDIYLAAKRIHSTLLAYHEDYYPVIEKFQYLPSIIENLHVATDAEEKEFLEGELEETLGFLQDFIGKHKKEEVITSNNLVFLGDKKSSTLSMDIEDIDRGARKNFIPILRNKIKKDFQTGFRRIMTDTNFPYIPYEVSTNGYSVFFIEIDTGIYLVLGADITGNGHRQTINNILMNLEDIRALEVAVKNPATRNKTLAEHEEILKEIIEDIEAPRQSMKRAKKEINK